MYSWTVINLLLKQSIKKVFVWILTKNKNVHTTTNVFFITSFMFCENAKEKIYRYKWNWKKNHQSSHLMRRHRRRMNGATNQNKKKCLISNTAPIFVNRNDFMLKSGVQNVAHWKMAMAAPNIFFLYFKTDDTLPKNTQRVLAFLFFCWIY